MTRELNIVLDGATSSLLIQECLVMQSADPNTRTVTTNRLEHSRDGP
jgi:hypothetical protein